MPVVAGLSLAGRPLATAGGVHKVVHDNSHDGRRALKLSARDITEGKVSERPDAAAAEQQKEGKIEEICF